MTITTRYLQLAALIGALTWGATIWWVNGLPAEDLPRLGWSRYIPHFDKVVHFGMYGILGGLAWMAIAPSFRPTSTPWVVTGAIIIVLLASMGAADEWRQHFVPGRSASIYDWYANALGALTAVSGLSFTHWWMLRPVRGNGAIKSEASVIARAATETDREASSDT